MKKSRVTIADVAERAGVSKMTVSRVINNKEEITPDTRNRVLQAMEALGYRPNRIARSLATNTTLRIGLVVPTLSNPYFGEIVEGIESVLWENDYHILLCNTRGNPEREISVIEILEDHRVDGVIVLSAHGSTDETSRALQNHHAAVVINTDIESGIAARIFTDEIKSMALAVNHLVEHGRKQLGYISFDINTYASRERYHGFELALNHAGITFTPQQQVLNVPTNSGQMAEVIYQWLAQHPEFDGLICYNNGLAARALAACAKLQRRVPHDIGIIGYDDTFVADLFTPSLTTIDLTPTKQEVGAIAANLLLECIENRSAHHETVVIDHRLILRDSTP